EPEPAPEPAGPSDLASPSPCGPIDPIAFDANVTGSLAVDLIGDGTADDELVGYEVAGQWYLRATVGGVVSEVELADSAWPQGVRPLGLADVGAITPGPEILSVIGGGVSAKWIGIHGLDAERCLFEFTQNGGPLDGFIDWSASFIDTFGCLTGDTVFGTSGFWRAVYVNHGPDDWSASSAAYHESTPGDFTYIGASDDYSEFLTDADLPAQIFDCPEVLAP
ncbi:MAG: hypothetical protein AAGG08_02015, partial [Actinomycetota bacterium]